MIKITQPCRNRQHSNLFSINYHYSSSFEIKLQKLGMIYFPKKYSLCQIMVQIIQNVISAVQIGQIQYSVMTIADSAIWRAAMCTTANFFCDEAGCNRP